MWLIALLIALLAVVVFTKLKQNPTQKTFSGTQPPKAEPVPESVAIKEDTPKPAKEDSIDKPTSQPEISQPRSRELIDEDSKNIAEIEAKIRAEIERRQAIPESIPFSIVCCVLDLDSHSETLTHEFIVQVYTKLRLQGQLDGQGPHRIPDYRPVRNMLESVLESAYEMLLYADENFEVVRSYMPMLLSKRRSLSSRDKYGDEDLQPWWAFSSRFAVDKLKGVGPLKFFMEWYASDSQRRTVSDQGLADMFGHFTRLAIPFLEYSKDREEVAPMTGVEYEGMLQEQIEENFSTANVSMTAATGDHGSDLIVDIDGIRIAIQAKYYQSAVGNAAVQEAFSGKGFYGADFAMVVCNSSYTKHAKELSDKLDVVLATTDNYIQIIEMLIDTKEAQPLERQRGI